MGEDAMTPLTFLAFIVLVLLVWQILLRMGVM
jgi:hypothetical protein